MRAAALLVLAAALSRARADDAPPIVRTAGAGVTAAIKAKL